MRFRQLAWMTGVLTLAALVVGAAGTASAQTVRGFSVDRFEPSERGSEWFVMDTLDFRGAARPTFGVVADYASHPLTIYNSDSSQKLALVTNQFFVHPGASLVLGERLRLAVSVPVQLFADGNSGSIDPTYAFNAAASAAYNGNVYREPSHAQRLGDIRAGADLRLFGEYGGPITMAIGAQVFFPTGGVNSYTGDGKFRIAPHILLAGQSGIFTWAVRGGATFRLRDETFARYPLGTEIFYGAAVGLRVADNKLVVGPEVYGSTVVSKVDSNVLSDSEKDPVFKRHTSPVEGIFGAHYTIGDNVRIGGGVGTRFDRGYGAPDFRGLLSVEVMSAATTEPKKPADRDGDGIADDEDSCPDQAGVPSGDPATHGCPAPKDQDGDGIIDGDDACPNVAGVQTSDPKTNGCPADKDGDSVIDSADACPEVAGVKSDDPQKNGCPPDQDGDGILDSEDACPEVPGLKTEDPKTNGCPDPDRDKDGVVNEQDACPDLAGQSTTDPKTNGCPKAFVSGGEIKITEQVKFKKNSAKLDTKGGTEVLQAVLQILNEHPEMTKVRVEGHTDNKGAAKKNKKLSAQRADSVVKWLIKNGVDKARLTSEGFGPDKPIDTNDTEEGRQNNRRVEFHIEGGEGASPAAPPADEPR